MENLQVFPQKNTNQDVKSLSGNLGFKLKF